jgi:hypothetical protein
MHEFLFPSPSKPSLPLIPSYCLSSTRSLVEIQPVLVDNAFLDDEDRKARQGASGGSDDNDGGRRGAGRWATSASPSIKKNVHPTHGSSLLAAPR